MRYSSDAAFLEVRAFWISDSITGGLAAPEIRETTCPVVVTMKVVGVWLTPERTREFRVIGNVYFPVRHNAGVSNYSSLRQDAAVASCPIILARKLH